MTDKEILKQIQGTDKITTYAVDTAAIRRGKANLALMMTLTTADHYDWFIGKFSSHNFFEYGGYRVYRRNVSKPPITIPQTEIDKLTALNRKLKEAEPYAIPDTLQLDLVNRIHYLTPFMLACAANLSKERMHYIGEICNVYDELLPDMDLVKIYSDVNHCADEEEALERICSDFNIPQETFEPVKIDERTHWGMVTCPSEEYFSHRDQAQLIVFQDQKMVLGEVEINDSAKTLTPHTQWVKSIHEYHGADISIPFVKPYPLWNLPAIQSKKDRIIFLTDNLFSAYKRQQKIDQRIQNIIDSEWKAKDRSKLYSRKNDWNDEFEQALRQEVQSRTKTQYMQVFEQLNDDQKYNLQFDNLSSIQDIAWITARLLYIYTPEFAGPSQDYYASRKDKGLLKNLILTCNLVIGNRSRNQASEKIFAAISTLNFRHTTRLETPSSDDIELCLGRYFITYLVAVYKTLCDVIENWQKDDRIQYEKLKSRLNKEQEFCWSSWFGGDEALNDVNWRELRKRDIVYVLTDEEEHSFRTALKVYVNTKRICSSIRFVIKNEIKSAQEFLDLALNKWNMSPEKLDSKKEYASMFETFDPNAALPPLQEYIIDPIISEKSITLMYAPTGIGKTWFSMCIALAASNGKPLFSNTKTSWLTPKPRRVVYIDSEMTEYHFKKRLQILSQMYQSDHQNLSFKLVADENMNLADEESGYCDQISQWLNDEAEAGRPVDLLILDNLSTLTGFNDSAKSWNTLFSWMKTLKEKRKHPCSVLVVHHSNKKGDQRGTSAKTATVDNVIKLEAQKNTTVNSVAFKVTVEKGRDIENVPAPFTVELQLPARGNAKPVFRVVGLNKDQNTRSDEAVLYLTGKKIPPHEVIATLTGLTPAYVRQLSHTQKKKK